MIERRKINALQALRAYAAISVLVGHAILEVLDSNGLKPSVDLFPLLAGVDLFFVISGFIMYATSSLNFGMRGATVDFWVRRLMRIVPLYWLFTALMVGALLLAGDLVRSTEFDLGHVISSFLFFPAERPGGRIAPVLSLGWTLNYEMFFYVLFGLTMLFKRGLGISILLTTLVALVIFGYIIRPADAAIRFWTNNIILEFGMGVLLGVFYARLPKMQSWAPSIVLFVIGLVLFFAFPLENFPRFIAGGIPATVIVASALVLSAELDSRVPRWLILLGNASFALYLCHRFVLRTLTVVFNRLELPLPVEMLGYVLLCVLLSSAVAILTYLWIETPVLSLLKGLKRSTAVPTSRKL